jgi:hypothetical protein
VPNLILSELLLIECEPIPLFPRAPINGSIVLIHIGKSAIWEVLHSPGLSLVASPRQFTVFNPDDTDSSELFILIPNDQSEMVGLRRKHKIKYPARWYFNLFPGFSRGDIVY